MLTRKFINHRPIPLTTHIHVSSFIHLIHLTFHIETVVLEHHRRSGIEGRAKALHTASCAMAHCVGAIRHTGPVPERGRTFFFIASSSALTFLSSASAACLSAIIMSRSRFVPDDDEPRTGGGGYVLTPEARSSSRLTTCGEAHMRREACVTAQQWSEEH